MNIEKMNEARQRWNMVAKPLHSLGRLEDMVIQIAGITSDSDFSLDKKCVVVMCADNGVVEMGVTQSESIVTTIVANAMAKNDGNINTIGGLFGADVFPVDIGMKQEAQDSGVIDRHIRRGTYNIAKGPAMTREECLAAINVGIDMVKTVTEKGYKIIATGEMGIGNTTTSSAMAAVLLNKTVEEVTGKGAGLTSDGLNRKIEVIKLALEKNNVCDRGNMNDYDFAVNLLSKVGGFDIAGMVGLFLGGAIYKVPVVIDGFISAVAAAIAKLMDNNSVNYMLPSHVSKEPAGKWLLEFIGLEAVINADMCLGEGTGAVMIFPMLDAALSLYKSTHKFDNLEIEAYEELK